MSLKTPRIAVRAVILCQEKLLLVNAWPNERSDLFCAPGGGVDLGSSLPDNLIREVLEETGLVIRVGKPCLVNEFHDPKSGFHQVEIFFRCTVDGNTEIDPLWQDPENVVTHHVWATQDMLARLRIKPGSLGDVAFGDTAIITYDPLEEIVL
ncbi:MAG: NUDIX domain-containing protein [Roseobacter sp.]